MSNSTAADMPSGGIVADDRGAWFKEGQNRWWGTRLRATSDDRHIDWQLTRTAKVLRVGDGTEND